MLLTISLPYETINDGVSFLHQRSVRETYCLHNHDFYEFFYIVKGKAIHNINSENQILSEGDFVLIRPADTHKYDFLDNFDFEIISVGYSCENFTAALKTLELGEEGFTASPLPPTINLHGYNLTDIYHKLYRINQIPCGNERRLYFRSVLPFLLYSFLSYSENTPRASLPVWLSEVLEEMNKPENYIVGLSRLLELAHSSQEHITRVFHRYLNLTPTEFINLKRINHAAKLITEGNMDITDICFTSGFNNLSHFYHCFKKQYGCSPKRFAAGQNDANP